MGTRLVARFIELEASIVVLLEAVWRARVLIMTLCGKSRSGDKHPGIERAYGNIVQSIGKNKVNLAADRRMPSDEFGRVILDQQELHLA